MLGLRLRLVGLAVLIVGVGIVPAYLLTKDSEGEAEATVVATQLDIRESALADYAERAFSNGAVADRVAEVFDDIDPEDVVPAHVSLEIEPGGVLRVTGRAETGQRAGEYVNVAAQVLANELTGDVNLIDDGEPGGGERLERPPDGAPGIGLFEVRQPATVTNRPDGHADALGAVLGVGVVYGVILAALVLLFPRRRVRMDV